MVKEEEEEKQQGAECRGKFRWMNGRLSSDWNFNEGCVFNRYLILRWRLQLVRMHVLVNKSLSSIICGNNTPIARVLEKSNKISKK